MRRIAIVFVIAVFLPSLGLGFLALRTAGEQRMILERQTAELYQDDTDRLAAQLHEAILGRQREFADHVRALLSTTSAQKLAADFAGRLAETDRGTAFVVSAAGAVIPAPPQAKSASDFVRANEAFLSNRAAEEIFPTQQNGLNASIRENAALQQNASQKEESWAPVAKSKLYADARSFLGTVTSEVARNVQPQRSSPKESQKLTAVSKVTPQISNFQSATSGGSDGVLARFNQNELELILWTRPPEGDGYVFGFALPAASVDEYVRAAFTTLDPQVNGACLAVLDENARPIATTIAGFTTDWKRPFVASEIGDTLPHWEAALYLLEPDQIARSAGLVTLTIVLLIALALAAILAGGAFVALDARRQLALAQKKTDFVSNVSHELKTPLTSIRMFAELLEQGRVEEPAKRSKYLRIITLESERLTRLINNVLDFARLERKHKTYHKTVLDLHSLLARIWEGQCAHLAESGFACEWIADDPPYLAQVDGDSIGQVVVNLLSNAEKYSNGSREITLHTWKEDGWLHVSVLDRGRGVTHAAEGRIFEAFYRADDSLASGVQGSGLGLTLARQIARDHGGDVTYRRREGGGSAFTLRLPLHNSQNL